MWIAKNKDERMNDGEAEEVEEEGKGGGGEKRTGLKKNDRKNNKLYHEVAIY